jgi:hypothetical protein
MNAGSRCPKTLPTPLELQGARSGPFRTSKSKTCGVALLNRCRFFAISKEINSIRGNTTASIVVAMQKPGQKFQFKFQVDRR